MVVHLYVSDKAISLADVCCGRFFKNLPSCSSAMVIIIAKLEFTKFCNVMHCGFSYKFSNPKCGQSFTKYSFDIDQQRVLDIALQFQSEKYFNDTKSFEMDIHHEKYFSLLKLFCTSSHECLCNVLWEQIHIFCHSMS